MWKGCRALILSAEIKMAIIHLEGPSVINIKIGYEFFVPEILYHKEIIISLCKVHTYSNVYSRRILDTPSMSKILVTLIWGMIRSH